MANANVPLGARIPEELKKRLSRFCKEHGLKMGHVVATALEDKLGELEQELEDLEIARKRLENPDFVDESEYDAYIRQRLSGNR